MNARDCRRFMGMGWVAEPLERRLLFSNVTLVTHGYATGYPSWVDDMAAAVGQSLGHSTNPWANVSLYHMVVTDPSGVAVTSFSRVAGPSPATSITGDIVITLDWSAVASISDVKSTTTVATVVASALLGQNADLGGAIVQSPIHLIGHSRGGSLIAALASDLGQSGLWVDDVTTLDPHPVSSLFNDYTALEPTDNVVFSDNYWRTDASEFLIPDGQSVTGAVNDPQTNGDNVKFESDLESGGGYSHDTNGGWDHSNVHLWYFGTVALNATQDPTDGAVIGPGYYGDPAPRSMTGFYYSQLSQSARPAAGLSALAGGSAARAHIAQTGPAIYSDLGSVSLTGGSGGLIANGSAAAISYRYQDVPGGALASFFLDNDTNPYNAFAHPVGIDPTLPTTGAAPNSAQRSLNLTWSSTGVQPGIYHLAARITSASGLARYDYMPAPIYVTPNGVEVSLATAPPTLTSTIIGDGTAQRSLFNSFTLNFDEPVSLAAGAVTLNQLTTNSAGMILTSTAVDPSAFTLTNPTGDGMTWIVRAVANSTIANSFGDFLDGVYQFTVHSALVTNAYGSALAGGDQTQSFRKLFGDVNGDGKVSNADFTRFSNAFGSKAGDANFLAALDYNHDGKISNADFTFFSLRFGIALYLPV